MKEALLLSFIASFISKFSLPNIYRLIMSLSQWQRQSFSSGLKLDATASFSSFCMILSLNIKMCYITTMLGGSAWDQLCSNLFHLKGDGQFLVESRWPMQELSDAVCIADLAFLVDITKHLNALNISLPGKKAVVSKPYSHIKALKTKLQLFQRHL